MTRIKKGILTLISLSLVLIYCLINDPSRDITLTLGLYAGSSWDVPNGESYQVIDQAIKKFEKKYPNVHVEYKSGIIKDDYSSWLANEITKGTIPDVFMVLPDDFNTLSSIGILKNLDRLIKEERIDTSLFYQSALFAGNNGSQYALPYEINPTIMCINHDLLTKVLLFLQVIGLLMIFIILVIKLQRIQIMMVSSINMAVMALIGKMFLIVTGYKFLKKIIVILIKKKSRKRFYI